MDFSIGKELVDLFEQRLGPRYAKAATWTIFAGVIAAPIALVAFSLVVIVGALAWTLNEIDDTTGEFGLSIATVFIVFTFVSVVVSFVAGKVFAWAGGLIMHRLEGYNARIETLLSEAEDAFATLDTREAAFEAKRDKETHDKG